MRNVTRNSPRFLNYMIDMRAMLVKLRESMNRGFELIHRYIDALGARWGISGEAFGECLRGILEEEFGATYDGEEYVYGLYL